MTVVLFWPSVVKCVSHLIPVCPCPISFSVEVELEEKIFPNYGSGNDEKWQALWLSCGQAISNDAYNPTQEGNSEHSGVCILLDENLADQADRAPLLSSDRHQTEGCVWRRTLYEPFSDVLLCLLPMPFRHCQTCAQTPMPLRPQCVPSAQRTSDP